MGHLDVDPKMSSRWEEAQVIKAWVEEIWEELGGDG